MALARPESVVRTGVGALRRPHSLRCATAHTAADAYVRLRPPTGQVAPYHAVMTQVEHAPVARSDAAAYWLATLNVLAVAVWLWNFFAAPGLRLFFDYGEPLYYAWAVALVVLGCVGLGMLLRMGRPVWRRQSAISLWLSCALLIVALGGYALIELIARFAFRGI
jgi:hypothetical protein